MEWQLDQGEFAQRLLAFWVDKGFGNASKKDLEAYALHLMLQGGHYRFPQDFYKAAHELKISETRLRNLYVHTQLVHGAYSESQARLAWAELVVSRQMQFHEHRVTFIVREPMLRQYIEEWVAQVNGFADSSFNRSLVVMGIDTLERVLNHLSAGREVILPAEYEEAHKIAKKSGKTLTRHFVEEFVKGAGKKTGDETLSLLIQVFKAFILI